MYRFDPEWNGEVVAERCIQNIEPYLGLNFPASDIPKVARELFAAMKVRHIPDVMYVPSTLVVEGDAVTIDLGESSLRSVSPIHIEYLINMGVSATLVGSLNVNGRLWGLISCQNKAESKYFNAGERDVLGWLCADISALIDTMQLRKSTEFKSLLAVNRQRLVSDIRSSDFKTLVRKGQNPNLLDVVSANGFALLIENNIFATGHVPDTDRIRLLNQRRLSQQAGAASYSTNSIAQDLGFEEDDEGIAGALFVSVPSEPKVTMIWFRDERRLSVKWGGDPAKAHSVDSQGRMSPRKSFELFLESIRGQCIPWASEEIESASELSTLIEIDSLRVNSAFSQTILNSIPEHITVLDENGVIASVNEAWIKFASENGTPELVQNFIGLKYQDFCVSSLSDATDGPVIWAGIHAVLQKKTKYFSVDYPCDSPTEKRWFRMHVYPMIAPCDGVLIAHENVTGKKIAELATNLAMEEAKKANLAKSRFLAAASHDLRQPLAALSLYTDLLGKMRDMPAQNIVAKMQVCLDNLSSLLNDLLDLSKLDAGVVTPCVSDFQVAELFDGLLSVYSPKATSKDLRLRFRPNGLNGRTDVVLLRRLLGNLISNALHYTDRGGVLVACRQREGKSWIEVRDSGIGIPSDLTQEIFEEFRQLGDGGRNHGSGLGLAIVAKTASVLGLEIKVRSAPGRGSVFAIELPLGQKLLPEIPVLSLPDLRPLRIVLLDDNKFVRAALSELLLHLGHRVHAAATRAEVFVGLDSFKPDILIADYRLAGGDTGIDVIDAVRGQLGSDFPAMLITGDTDPQLLRHMQEQRIVVLHKPLNLDLLQAHLLGLTEKIA